MRGLIRLILLVVILVGLAAFFMNYGSSHRDSRRENAVGTTGEAPDSGRSRGRETGAAIGEKVGASADKARGAVSDVSLTSKIKAKMALDDSIEANAIDVDTEGSVVTLTGTVRTEAERERAVRLARETEGVTQVIDRLRVAS